MRNYILGAVAGFAALLIALAASEVRRQIREQTGGEE
jgi:hypothetical protein